MFIYATQAQATAAKRKISRLLLGTDGIVSVGTQVLETGLFAVRVGLEHAVDQPRAERAIKEADISEGQLPSQTPHEFLIVGLISTGKQ